MGVQVWPPGEICTDQGKEFVNKVLKELVKLLDIKHSTTSGYHPQTNSMAEVCNKTIQRYLASFVSQSTLDWELYLAPLAFCYNTSLHESILHTPFYLCYGYEAMTPQVLQQRQKFYGEDSSTMRLQRLQLARQLAVDNNFKMVEKNVYYHDKNLNPINFRWVKWLYWKLRNFWEKTENWPLNIRDPI